MVNYYEYPGRRIDVGQTIKSKYGPVVLLYLCPHALLTERGFYCPYKDGTNKCNNISTTDRCDICYTVQELEYYNKEHGTHTVFEKESNILNTTEIKEARRMPTGNCVSVDDIVEVTVCYIGGDSLYVKLGRRNTFKARVVSFEDDLIVLDLSTPYNSNQVYIPYNLIKTIKTEEGPACL